MPEPRGDTQIEALASELSTVARLDWRDHRQFDFDELQVIAGLLSLSNGVQDVTKLRARLISLVAEIRREEEESAPINNRSIADAADALLVLDDDFFDYTLRDRRDWIRAHWKKKVDGKLVPLKSAESFKRNQEKSVYADLATRMLESDAVLEGERPQRLSTPKKMPPVAPAPWPVKGKVPTAGQEVVILSAAQGMRRGPMSPLVKLVREFEPYWRATDTMIFSLEGSYKEIWRSGLLHDYGNFVALPAGFDGGLVHATEVVVAAAEAKRASHVVYLIDPRDDSSLYPATSSIKRECILTKTPFLTTYQGAARWFRLEWARRVAEGEETNDRELLVYKSRFPEESVLEDPPGAVALAAHDRHKLAMMDFADRYVKLIEHHYPDRWATRVTGHLLNGGSIFDPEYEKDILYDVRGESRDALKKRIENKTFEWEKQDRRDGPGSPNWVRQLTRGREGAVVQLARKVLDNECDTVIFFQDAETPREHDMEMQVLDRAAQLVGSNCLLLYDEESAGRWADNVTICLDSERVPSATTLIEAYRRMFGVELILAYPEAGSPADLPISRRTAPMTRDIWDRVTATAATYVAGVLLAAARARDDGFEPVRFGFTWGVGTRDILGELPEGDPRALAGSGDRHALAGAFGLHEFVDQHAASDLYTNRAAARNDDKWPPLSDDAPYFRPHELRVVPTTGLMGSRDRSLEAHALVDRAVKIIGGEAVPYPEAAFLFSAGRADPLGGAPEEDWKQLDLLLLSAEPLNASNRRFATGLPAELANHYAGADAAVGTIYLESGEDGVVESRHDSYQQAGITVEQIGQLKNGGSEVVLVNGAKSGYTRPAWAALKAGLASTFVTDETFARDVLKVELAELKSASRTR